MSALDRALERAYRDEVARFARLFGADVQAGTYRGTVDGNPPTMRLALEIEGHPAFKRLSFRRRLLMIAGAPNLTAALRSETRTDATDEVLALASWCLAAGVLAAARAPSSKPRHARSVA